MEATGSLASPKTSGYNWNAGKSRSAGQWQLGLKAPVHYDWPCLPLEQSTGLRSQYHAAFVWGLGELTERKKRFLMAVSGV